MNRRDALKCLSGILLFPSLEMSKRPVTWTKYKKFHPEHKYDNEILFVKLPSNRIFQFYVPRKGRTNKCESEGMLTSIILQDHMSSSYQVHNDWIDAEDIAQQYFWKHIKPEYRRTKMESYWAKEQ